MKSIKTILLNITVFKKTIPVFIVMIFLFVACSSLTNTVQAASFPSLKIEPKSIDFGTFMIGSSSPAQIVTITNDADSTNVLTIFDIYLEGLDANSFSIINDNSSGRILDGSISSTLELVFQPASEGVKSAILIIPSNANDKPYEVPLNGTGMASNNQTPSPTGNGDQNTSNANQTSGPIDNSSSTNWLLIIGISSAVVLVIAGILISKRLANR